jgi:hypothetical protein
MAAFNTATATAAAAAAALASTTPCRASALAARLPAARWAPLRCSPPGPGLRRATGPSRRGSAALRVRTFSFFFFWHSRTRSVNLVDFPTE